MLVLLFVFLAICAVDVALLGSCSKEPVTDPAVCQPAATSDRTRGNGFPSGTHYDLSDPVVLVIPTSVN